MKKILSLIAGIMTTMLFALEAHPEVMTVAEGLRIAQQNNRQIKIAEHEERISRTDALITRSAMLPSVNASLNQTYLSDRPGALFGTQSVPTGEKDFYSYSLNVQQTLYDFRRNASKYEASAVIADTKRFDAVRVRNMIALDFVTAYFDLLDAEKMLRVAEKEVERLESHDKVARALFEEGSITKNDQLQAEVRISDARQKMLTAQNLKSIMVSRLNNILVRPLNANIEAVDMDGPSYDSAHMDIEKAWETAEKQRVEIEIVNETLKSLDLEEQSVRAEYYPSFFAKGGYDYTENRYQLHEGNWSIILGMDLNLYSGDRTRASILKIAQQKDRLLEQKNKLIDDIKLEVEKYVLDFMTAREKTAVTRDAVRQAEENLRINRVKYEEGVGTATDVLDAVTLLTTAETNYYRALYDLRKAEAGVLYATGQDLSEVYK